MPHVQNPRHIGRRNHHRKWLFTRISFGMEDILIFPELEPFVLASWGLYFDDNSIVS